MNNSQPLVAIVDDDPSVRRALKRLVLSLGMLAQTFSSGQQFLDYLETEGPQGTACVILDVQMPGMTGLEVLQRLRASNSDLPVIVITAHDTADTREATLAAGVVAFLRKPFDDDVFASALEAAIECRAAVPRDQS